MKNIYLIISLILATLLFSIDSYAQKEIKGRVLDESGNSIEGVVIKLKKYEISTISDKNGNYKLWLPQNIKTIEFSEYDNYNIKEVKFISDTEINIIIANNSNLDIFDLTLEELMQLKVYSASKKKEAVIEAPAAVNIITSDDIKLLNFNSLEQILEYATGLASINGEGNIFTTTTIRGNTLINYNTNTLLLYDGIPLYNAYHGSFNFQSIPISSIDRIEIVKGSNSVLYGSNAINGVINIISKKASNNKNKIEGQIKGGSFNTVFSNSSIISKKGDWEFYLFTDIITSSGEILPFNDEKGNTLDLEKTYKGFSSISKIIYKDLSISINYNIRSLPGLRTRKFHTLYTSEIDTVGILQYEFSKEHSFRVNIEYNKKISDKLFLTARSNGVEWHLNKELYDGYWDYSSFGIYNDIEFSLESNDKLYNKFGISYNHYLGRRYKSQNDSYDIGKDYIWTNDFAVFLNGEYKISNSLKFFYGGRYYFAKYNQSVFDNFSPRAALIYTPNQKIYFKAIYGQSFRTPTYFEKEVASSNVLGNPDLLPEKSVSYDFIISSKIKKIQFDIDFFYSEISDRIQRVTSLEDPNLKINMNVGKISLYGCEFNSKFRIQNKIYGFIGYSYTEGINLESEEKLEYIYNNMFNFGANIQLSKWLYTNLSAKHMDNWGQANSYTLVNWGLTIKPTSNLPISIELKIDNLLDTKVYLPEIARSSELVPVIPKTLNRIFFIGISYKFQ